MTDGCAGSDERSRNPPNCANGDSTGPALVLVHGGAHTAACWEPTLEYLCLSRPRPTALAVELPGRGAHPADMTALRTSDFVDAVVEAVHRSGCDEVILVGHSMAGLTVPRVAAALGARRVREMIFVGAFVPRQGTTVADTLSGPFRPLVKWVAQRGKPFRIPAVAAWFVFCNGMTVSQRRRSLGTMCAEIPSVAVEPADHRGMPPTVPITWVMTLRDRAVSPHQQRACIQALGGVDRLLTIDSPHNAMVAEPARLAEVLLDRWREHSRRVTP